MFALDVVVAGALENVFLAADWAVVLGRGCAQLDDFSLQALDLQLELRVLGVEVASRIPLATPARTHQETRHVCVARVKMKGWAMTGIKKPIDTGKISSGFGVSYRLRESPSFET